LRNTLKLKEMKLYITDLGDPSVGIFAMTWILDCPFEYDKEEIENMEQFRIDQLKIYNDYSEGHLIADYDFECYKDEENES